VEERARWQAGQNRYRNAYILARCTILNAHIPFGSVSLLNWSVRADFS
jgi:hypothetical protein